MQEAIDALPHPGRRAPLRLRRELDAYWGPALGALKDAAEAQGRP